MEEKIEQQRKIVFGEQPEIKLVGACKLNEGVLSHSNFEKKKYEVKFQKSKDVVTFFIPASGSGSRMFQFLFDFLEEPNEENRSKTEKFLNAIQEFAFFELLPFSLKMKVREYDINLDEFVAFLLKEHGLKLGGLPKGLLPFHRTRSFILNAFQEQMLQGLRLKEDGVQFHFTVNPTFEKEIQATLHHMSALTGRKTLVETSFQNPETDSFAFDVNQQEVKRNDGSLLRRPSGHGALLENLNKVDGDILFVKNIDNIQHEAKSDAAIHNFQYLGGLLQELKEDVKQVLEDSNKVEALKKLNLTYQIWQKDVEFERFTDQEIEDLLLKPIRVCGMVRNEGQPGGGPFWVEHEDGSVSKQIVEKAQIKMKGEQYRLMVQSQYFNPVLIALSTKDVLGNKVDLTEFADPQKYFIVDKKFEGKPIKFMERPGLWNGSMANWLTVFVEVPSETFTPVKTVLDLLSPPHREN